MASIVKICPQCRKASYVNETLQRTKCEHCGFMLNAWAEKRANARIEGQYETTINAGTDVYHGQSVDLSYKGFRIAYNGTALDKGTRIIVTVDHINARRKAEVVWSRQHSTQTAHIGIKMI